MRLDLLDRWLLKELLGPLLFFIALFTLLLLTGGVMFELVRQMVDKNLPITIAVQVLLFSIPRWLAFSVPIGTLMASLFVFTRLSANSELTALRSLGVERTDYFISTKVSPQYADTSAATATADSVPAVPEAPEAPEVPQVPEVQFVGSRTPQASACSTMVSPGLTAH